MEITSIADDLKCGRMLGFGEEIPKLLHIIYSFYIKKLTSAVFEEYASQHQIFHINMARYHTSYGHFHIETHTDCLPFRSWQFNRFFHLDVHISYQVLCMFR